MVPAVDVVLGPLVLPRGRAGARVRRRRPRGGGVGGGGLVAGAPPAAAPAAAQRLEAPSVGDVVHDAVAHDDAALVAAAAGVRAKVKVAHGFCGFLCLCVLVLDK